MERPGGHVSCAPAVPTRFSPIFFKRNQHNGGERHQLFPHSRNWKFCLNFSGKPSKSAQVSVAGKINELTEGFT